MCTHFGTELGTQLTKRLSFLESQLFLHTKLAQVAASSRNKATEWSPSQVLNRLESKSFYRTSRCYYRGIDKRQGGTY